MIKIIMCSFIGITKAVKYMVKYRNGAIQGQFYAVVAF